MTGAIVTAASAFSLAWAIHWARGDQSSNVSSGRVIVVVILFVALVILGYAYVRRQWLQYLRQQTLTEASKFVAKAQGLDVAISAAVALIQEVELVSRGYRMCVLESHLIYIPANTLSEAPPCPQYLVLRIVVRKGDANACGGLCIVACSSFFPAVIRQYQFFYP